MGVPLEKVGKVAPIVSKIFMKGRAFGTMPAVGGYIDLDINFDTIYSDKVEIEGYANFTDIFSKITTIDNKIGIISAKTENLSVGSVDNMTVYYQNDSSGDDIVLVNRIINKARNMWTEGFMNFGPLQDDISRKIWIDKPDDIHAAAQYSRGAYGDIESIKTENRLNTDWLYRYYNPAGLEYSENSSCYHAIIGAGNLLRALANPSDEVRYNDYWRAPGQSSEALTYTVSGFTKAVKKILAFEEKIDAIKAKTDKIPDDLLTRLQSIATDASGANVKSGSAERAAKEAERVLKEEVKPKLQDVLKQVRASCAWVLDGCCRLVKAVFAPMKECFDSFGGDQTRDSNTNLTPVFETPNFGVTGNVEGQNPAGYTFDCPALQRPWPYWPLSVSPGDRDETNFRSIVEDLPQAVAAYYWPSAYQGAEK